MRKISFILIALLFCFVIFACTPAVLPPYFSPLAGEVPAGTDISVLNQTEGATIYYTTDGSNPDTGSEVYSYTNRPVVDGEVTIKAVSYLEGQGQSEIAEASYSILPRYDINLTVTPSNGGYIMFDPPKGDEGWYKGTEVELIPNPQSGYVFDSWGGADSGEVSANEPYIIIMSKDMTLEAVFANE